VHSAEGEEEFVINSQGGLSAKPLDRKDKKSISIVDWLSAALTAEEQTLFYHGESHAKVLVAHHKFMPELARLHGWQVAVEYDILQCFLLVQNPTHDLGTLDTNAVSLVVSRLMTQQFNKSFPTSHSPPSFSKCPVPGDSTTSQSLHKKSCKSHHCFRCDYQGHLPEVESTSAGHVAYPLARGEAKSKHALLGPDNKNFCFTWAKDPFCPFEGACTNYHGCSICGGPSHGAKIC
jgi:hypothetical protein